MHRYDTVLKDLLQESENSILKRIAGVNIERWINTELPQVRQTRMDMLGEGAGPERRLVHVELQSRNDAEINLRMAEYSLAVRRKFGRFPKQFVLYVGAPKMRMPAALDGTDHVCRYSLVDIRTLDAETLLASPFDADALLAILARYRDRREMVRRILARIVKLEGGRRQAALARLSILAGLRKLEDEVEAEAREMPITEDIMDHKIIGPAIRKGLRKGRLEGQREGRLEGQREGREEEGRTIVRGLIEKRFGKIPDWAEERLSALSLPEIERLSLRVLDARGIRKLFNGD